MPENNESIQELKALVEERQQLVAQKETTESRIQEIESRLQEIASYAQVVLDICGDLKRPELHPIFQESTELPQLTVRTYNCLNNANILTIGALVEKTEAELLGTKNFGRKSLNELREVFGEYGLRLGMTQHEMLKWVPPTPEKSTFITRP